MNVDARAVRMPAVSVTKHLENLDMLGDVAERIVEHVGPESGENGVLRRMHGKADTATTRGLAGQTQTGFDFRAEAHGPRLREGGMGPADQEARLNPEQALKGRQSGDSRHLAIQYVQIFANDVFKPCCRGNRLELRD